MPNPDEGTTEFLKRRPDAVKLSLGKILSGITILCAIGGVFGAYTLIQYKLEELSKKNGSIEIRLNAQDVQSIQIRETLVEIKTELRYIRQDLKKGFP